jgi:hypothetical protein
MTEKLAAALLQLMEVGPDGKLRRIVDEKWAKDKSAKEIIGLFECDHWPMSVFMGGGNNPQNLTWRTIEDHREKTKRDAKFHAKVRRKAKLEERPTPKRVAQDWTAAVTSGSGQCGKEVLTEANKAYRKAVYAKRKAERKKWLASIKGKKK